MTTHSNDSDTMDGPALGNATTNAGEDGSLALEVVSKLLLVAVVFGLAASCSPSLFFSKFTQWRGIAVGMAMQFIVLPLLGFMVVAAFKPAPVFAIMIIVCTTGPGGSYSNWWCSLFNADLALSVAMTTVSSIVALGMMPLNLYIYVTVLYNSYIADDSDLAPQLDWIDIVSTLGLVLFGIAAGVFSGRRWPQHANRFNVVGNLCGLALIVLGLFATSTSDEPWYTYDSDIIVAVLIPPLAAMIISLLAASLLKLQPAERVAVAIEASYQNSTIPLAFAFSLDKGTSGLDGGVAAGIPAMYQFMVTPCIILLSVVAWKLGWTYAPPSTPFLKLIALNFQPHSEDDDPLVTEHDSILQESSATSLKNLYESEQSEDVVANDRLRT